MIKLQPKLTKKKLQLSTGNQGLKKKSATSRFPGGRERRRANNKITKSTNTNLNIYQLTDRISSSKKLTFNRILPKTKASQIRSNIIQSQFKPTVQSPEQNQPPPQAPQTSPILSPTTQPQTPRSRKR